MNSIIIVTILLSAFSLINLIIFIYVYKTFKTISDSKLELKISIVIAAKNEEKNIPSLIQSLKNLDYQQDKFEIIIVDDNSTDNTFAAAKKLAEGIKNLFLYKVGEKLFPGKKGALSFGISRSNNPFIMITDADCHPEPGWLKIYAGMFYEGYDFIFGIAPFIQNKNLVNKISCFESLRNWLLTITSAKLRMPYSAAARNFGFKKSSFENINGYANTTETLSGDDDLLLREAYKKKLSIGVAASENSFVYSSTKQNFNDYFLQKSRHIKTSFYYLFKHQLLLGFWHILNLTMLFSFIPGIFQPIYLLLFACKILIDALVITSLQKKFHYRFNFFEIIYLQIIYEVFLIVNFFGAALRKDKWK